MTLPDVMPGWELCRRERDALVLLGLLSHVYVNWDPPIGMTANPANATHYHGLNIHAVVVDNADGEVLALERNRIHEENSPLQHAEQLTLRAAIARVQQKRPRDAATTVENYYRHQLFYADGCQQPDFVYKGCTLVTTLEPCPMCTGTLCVCRMKRVAYIVEDQKYGGSWNGRLTGGKGIQNTYYSNYELHYGPLDGSNPASPLCVQSTALYAPIARRIDVLRKHNVPDTLLFDSMHGELGAIFDYFQSVSESDLITSGDDRGRNAKSLLDLKRLCNVPV